ncbi:MAG: hypothetical protein WCG04_06995 [Alphaproteobacteria bacterium]
MITICKPNGEKLKTIPNSLSSGLDRDEFFKYVSAGELLEDHLELDEQNNWSFTIFPGAIRICTGDPVNPTWVNLTPDINVGKFKKDWYLDYCKKHGYSVDEAH